MAEPLLSRRLEAIISMVTKDLILADIGTDHAFVPICLILRGITPFAYAMDINEGPLKRAEENIALYGLSDRIRTILSDGLAALKPKMAGSILIAGMGGDLISSILAAAPDVIRDAAELILSPHTEAYKVRIFLRTNGFMIDREDMVEEEGKYYPVIHAVYTGHNKGSEEVKSVCPDPADVYGPFLLKTKHPVLAAYLRKEEEVKTRILKQIEENSPGQHPERIRQLKDDLRLNRCAGNMMEG